MKNTAIRNRRIFVSLLILLLSTLFLQWGTEYERSRGDLTRAFVEEGRASIDTYQQNTIDKLFWDGSWYSDKQPGLSVLSIPSYLLARKLDGPPTMEFGFWETFFTILVSGVLIGVVVFWLLSEWGVSSREVSLAGLLFLGSGLFNYSTVYTDVLVASLFLLVITRLINRHSPAVALFTAFFSLSFTPLAIGPGLALIGVRYHSLRLGLFLGSLLPAFFIFSVLSSLIPPIWIFGSFVNFEQLILYFFGLVGVVGLWKLGKERFVVLIIAVLLGFVPLVGYNYMTTGNPGYFLKVVPSSGYDGTGCPVSDVFCLFNSNPDTLSFFKAIKLPFNAIQLLMFPFRGLFFYWPVFLLGIAYLLVNWKSVRSKEVIVAVAVGVLVPASLNGWYAFGSFGPRYLVPLLVLLFIPTLKGIQSYRRGHPWLVALLLIVSLFHTVLGAQPWGDYSVSFPDGRLPPDIVLENPIYGFYLPNFYFGGPRSGILAGMLTGAETLDIRMDSPLPLSYFNPSRGFSPFDGSKGAGSMYIPLFVYLIMVGLVAIPLLVPRRKWSGKG